MKITTVIAAVLAATATLAAPSVAFSSQQTPPATRTQKQTANEVIEQHQLHHQHQHQQQQQQHPSRRTFFGNVGATAATVIGAAAAETILLPFEPANAAIKTGPANSFTGDYEDPNHPGCLRQVKVVGGPLNGSGTRSAFPVMEITGYDGSNNNGESKVCKERPPSRDFLWQVKGSVKSPTTAQLDLSLRGGGDEPILVNYENGSMVFPDGNKWKKIPEQKERRPKDLSTLSDGPRFREKDDDDDY